jgi:hypothetical protein
MKKLILIVFLLLLVFVNCTENFEPLSSEEQSSTLLFTSFESGGTPYLDDWISPGPPIVKFANDAPPQGGNYSIFLKAREIGARVHTAVPALVGTHKYRLTFWAKSTEDPGYLHIYLKQGGNEVNTKSKSIRTKDWTAFTIETEYTASVGDSIEVMLIGSLYTVPQGFNYFDLIKLEYID